jgi:uncharacterized membrane protein YidH (DUF202 family)
MGPLILFGIGRVIYSLIERRDRWFVISEFVASGLLVGVGLLLMDTSHDALRGVSIGILFLITGLLPRIVLPRHPIEASVGSTSGPNQIVPVGIIDFVWISIMATTLAIIAFTLALSPFVGVIKKGMNPEYYKQLFEITVFLLGKTIDVVFLLGGILAACMAILWAGEIWRKSQERDKIQYKLTTVCAIKMVVGYFIVILNAVVWIGIPLYQKMINLAEMMKL